MADIASTGQIGGRIASSGQLKGTVNAQQLLHGFLRVPIMELYIGPYSATPKFSEAIILKTKDKSMVDDVTIKKMPQYEVSNDAGGKTLILGDEYYGN